MGKRTLSLAIGVALAGGLTTVATATSASACSQHPESPAPVCDVTPAPAPTKATPTATPTPPNCVCETPAPVKPTPTKPVVVPTKPVPPVVVVPTPVPPVKPTPKPTPTPDTPVKPQAVSVDYTAQVDTYTWHDSASYGKKIASFDDDGVLKYREDGWMWMTKAAKRYTGYGHLFVTFSAPENATPAQLVAAYNAAAPASKRITTTSTLGAVGARGSVTDVWLLGDGADATAAWGAAHTTNQRFLGRR